MNLITGDHIPWRERMDMDEVEAISDDGFDDLFESLDEVGDNTSIRRVSLNTGQPRRYEGKTAATNNNNWDEEFKNAQSHARSLLASLGK